MTGDERGLEIPGPPLTGYGLAIVIGLLASSLHWIGLLVGGILVGLQAPSTARGIAYGAAWGGFAWLVFVALLATNGVVPTVEMGQLFGVSIGIALVLGAIGGSARELKPLLGDLSLG